MPSTRTGPCAGASRPEARSRPHPRSAPTGSFTSAPWREISMLSAARVPMWAWPISICPEQVEVNAIHTRRGPRSAISGPGPRASRSPVRSLPGATRSTRIRSTITNLAGGTTQPVAFAPWTVGPGSRSLLRHHSGRRPCRGQQRLQRHDHRPGPGGGHDLRRWRRGNGPAGFPLSAFTGTSPTPSTRSRPSASICPGREAVSLRIYDLAGRLVRNLYQGDHLDAGEHERSWNGLDESGRTVATGVFFYRLEAGSFSETRRMTLVK